MAGRREHTTARSAAERARRPYSPRPVQVVADGAGRPVRVGARPVESIREEWLVEDRWWSGRTLRRHYFELVLAGGRNQVVYRDAFGGERGAWYAQRG